MVEPFRRDDTDLRWSAEDPRPPVGPLHRVVALPGAGAVEFPDPGGVVVRGIDGDGLVREEGVEGGKTAFDESRRFCVALEVHPVEEVGAVPGVRPDRRGKALLREIRRDPLRCGERCVMLLIRRRDPARPHRVDVDREPAPANDVDIRRGGVLPGEPHLDPVRPPGKEGGVDVV